jgi:hypothetical protein
VDTGKIEIFVLVLVVFLVLSRRLFSGNTTHDPSDLPPSSYVDPPPSSFGGLDFAKRGFPEHGFPEHGSVISADARSSSTGLVGSELPFPVSLPPRQAGPDGKYNRPLVLNYYFKKLDLLHGPEDPRSFCDEFFVQLEEPETQVVWTNEYIVATPTGLQQLMDSGGHDSLHFDGMLIVVPKWNTPNLLKIIMDEVMEGYATREHPKEDTNKSSKRYWI